MMKFRRSVSKDLREADMELGDWHALNALDAHLTELPAAIAPNIGGYLRGKQCTWPG